MSNADCLVAKKTMIGSFLKFYWVGTGRGQDIRYDFKTGTGTNYPTPSRVWDGYGKYLYISGWEWDRGAPSQTRPGAIPM